MPAMTIWQRRGVCACVCALPGCSSCHVHTHFQPFRAGGEKLRKVRNSLLRALVCRFCIRVLTLTHTRTARYIMYCETVSVYDIYSNSAASARVDSD